MKLLLVTACVLFTTLPFALSLDCFACVSTKSWDDCEDNEKSITCPSGLDRCMKVYTKISNVEAFAKSCSTEALCNKDDNPACKGKGSDITCDIECCETDKCNAGSVTGVSGFMLMICAVVSLGFLKA